MPHIHTEPGQHDFTVSAYIIRQVDGEWKCLVHKHKRLGVLMQIGGHIELEETPWAAVAHEIAEESGYSLRELTLLQYRAMPVQVRGAVTHPTPYLVNTHTAGPQPHYHTDFCYAFIAESMAAHLPEKGESADLRWLTVRELKQLDAASPKELLGDVLDIYESILSQLPKLQKAPADGFSLDEPEDYWNFTA